MPNPAPKTQYSRTFPTPRTQDLLFWEHVDVSRKDSWAGSNKYGDAHPDTDRYPNHILTYIEQGDDQGGWEKWWYAADRDSQDEYNFDITYPYSGSHLNPRVTRTYILRRGSPEAENGLPLGSADPGGSVLAGNAYLRPNGTDTYLRPGGVDTYVSASSPVGVLVAQSERRLPEPIGSIYVEVTRVYDVIPGSEDSTSASGVTQVDGGYTVTRPLQDKNWVKLVWKLTLPRTTADTYRTANLAACIIPGYTNLSLIDEVIGASDEENQTSTITRIYLGNINDSTAASTPVIQHKRELPGVIPPEKFLSVLITRTETEGVLNPGDASYTSQTVPANYTLLAVEISATGVNDGSRVTVSRHYGSIARLIGRNWDDNLRDYVEYETTVMTPAAADDLERVDGEEMTITPLNYYWTMVTIERPTERAITAVEGIPVYSPGTYYTMMPFSWPAVLQRLDGYTVGLKDSDGNVISGTGELFYDYELKRSWSGLCKAAVQIGWQKANPTIAQLVSLEYMHPEAIDLNWPIGSIHVPPSLHRAYRFLGTTGTEHPRYAYAAGFDKTFAATNYVVWPDTLLVRYEIQPYKGGWRLEKTTVYKPEA